ncbi:hypothetical protein [Aeromonas sp. SCS5]|uniref:hypothetical protein n=1 Tax=Aeromonas sp. SCS5 TaxID=1519205 RepID=UPI00117832DC|nr:hypothetical protein [Aeromonas sp. SCS5]
MTNNKIEIYSGNGKLLKEYNDVCGHDLSRTLFNHVAELEGWSVEVNEIGMNGVERGNDKDKEDEGKRRRNQETSEKVKIMNSFSKHNIGKVVFIGVNKESFSISYKNNSLILDRSLD